ncbi:hypothetical protein MWU49_12840 [Alcanivorax sp. S6407]|uniref:hypothetical protein n=1 Tax=Alcanivorax sp. S6407 TaxID=2926424 RepID=UPI001FF421EB|nr:hypothetical protein [Alcanivorax sp. S6407]MCK0154598.1 hypothetical protein [Alcanivorax sp. S6407]
MKIIKTAVSAALLGLSVSALAAQGGMGQGGMGGMHGMGAGHMMYNGEGPVTMPMMREHMGMMQQQMQGMPMNGDPEVQREHIKNMMKQMELHMEMMQNYLDETEGKADKPAKK